VDAVRNLEVTFRSLGGGSKEKMTPNLRGRCQGVDAEARSIKWCMFNDTCNLSMKLIFNMTENYCQSILLDQIACNKQVTVSWKWQKIAVDTVSQI